MLGFVVPTLEKAKGGAAMFHGDTALEEIKSCDVRTRVSHLYTKRKGGPPVTAILPSALTGEGKEMVSERPPPRSPLYPKKKGASNRVKTADR
jgi:hypothetical protein